MTKTDKRHESYFSTANQLSQLASIFDELVQSPYFERDAEIYDATANAPFIETEIILKK